MDRTLYARNDGLNQATIVHIEQKEFTYLNRYCRQPAPTMHTHHAQGLLFILYQDSVLIPYVIVLWTSPKINTKRC